MREEVQVVVTENALRSEIPETTHDRRRIEVVPEHVAREQEAIDVPHRGKRRLQSSKVGVNVRENAYSHLRSGMPRTIPAGASSRPDRICSICSSDIITSAVQDRKSTR